jgi:protein phosphatase
MASEPLAVPTETLIRLVRPSLVVLCGPSACGKSTFAKKHFRPTQIISSDWARSAVCDDERDQRFNAQAFDLVHFIVHQRLVLNRLCVVDSTALTAQARRDLLALAKRNQVPATMIIFHVPLETCAARDEMRERSVGRPVIEKQFQNFALSLNTIRQEGFEQVVELHNGDIETVRFEIQFRPLLRPQRADTKLPPWTNQGRNLNHRSSGESPANGSAAPKPSALISPQPSVNPLPPPTPNPPTSQPSRQSDAVSVAAGKK